MLQQYGIKKFLLNLKELGFESIRSSANHYGLSLILGGAEVRLWDLAKVYGNLARELQVQNETGFSPKSKYQLRYAKGEIQSNKPNIVKIDNGATWLTFDALSEMDRPIEGTQWSQYESSQKIAWKTGTSFGHRDAWAVGITSDYLVAAWVGNADGEGRPGLTGARSAAPIMFDAFKLLPNSDWFDKPELDLKAFKTCKQSGYKATKLCQQVDTVYATYNAERTSTCPYHQRIHLNENEDFQVNSDCFPATDIVTKSWFVLPTVMEWYYKRRNPNYKTVPLLMSGCSSDMQFVDIIYPQPKQKIFIPKSFNNQFEKIVCKATHRQVNSTIYWHLDELFLGTTNGIHQMEITAQSGFHTLTLLDATGASVVREFEVVGK
jgi:penicillin-binding protein 1C